MYYVVTGAAGFIGSNLVEALNERGDHRHHRRGQPRARPTSSRTWSTARSPTTSTRTSSSTRLEAGDFDGAIDAVLHQGACSDTMETDGRYMMENNYRYSLALLDCCQDEEVPLHLRLVGRGVRRGHACSARSASTRRRSTSTATRSSCSTRCVRRRLARAHARRSRACATSTSTARARRTRGAWPRSRSTSSTSTAPRAG